MKIVTTLFRNIETSFLTIFLMLFSIGQLQRIQLPDDQALYLHDGLIVLFLGWKAARSYIVKNPKKIKTILKKITTAFPLETMWVAWLLGGMIIGSFAGQISLQSILYVCRLVIYLLFISAVAKSTFGYSPRQGITAAGTLVCIWGLLQYVFLPDTRFLFMFGWDAHYYRLISTLFDPAFTGAMLILTLGFLQTPALFPILPGWGKRSAEVLLVLAIAATFSRASYIALGCLLSLLIVKRKATIRWAVTLLFLLCFFIWLLPKPGGEGVNLGRTSTAEARLANAQHNLVTLSGWQWLWGRGLFNTDNRQDYETPSHAQLPDSIPILILNASGLGGILLAAGVLRKWLPRWWHEDPIWTSVLLSLACHSLFNNTLLQPFILLALGLGKVRQQNPRNIRGGNVR